MIQPLQPESLQQFHIFEGNKSYRDLSVHIKRSHTRIGIPCCRLFHPNEWYDNRDKNVGCKVFQL